MSLEFEVGELKGRMMGIEVQVKNMEDKMNRMDVKLNTILDHVAQAKGGWKATTLLISISGGVGAIVSFIVKRIV